VTDFESAHVLQHQGPEPGAGQSCAQVPVGTPQSCRAPGGGAAALWFAWNVAESASGLSTLYVSDWIVWMSDWLGFGMFSGDCLSLIRSVAGATTGHAPFSEPRASRALSLVSIAEDAGSAG